MTPEEMNYYNLNQKRNKTMKVKIYDYAGDAKEVEITQEVKQAVLLTITGDQVLLVKYADGGEERFDSNYTRMSELFDGWTFVELTDGADFKECVF